MSLYVLDTDIVTLYRAGHPRVCRHIGSHSSTDLAVTVLTIEEQLSGWYSLLRKAKQPTRLAWAYRELADAVQFFSALRILSYTLSAIGRYDALRTLKLTIRKMDLRFAAVVLENSGVLVTRNLRDFRRVPNLAVENWAV